MKRQEKPPTLDGCDVLPPLEPDDKPTTPKRKPNRRKTAKGRFEVVNTFVDFTLRDLKRNEIAVWMILYRDTKKGIARTGQTDIARRAGISDRTVRRIIGKLERLGLLTVAHRGGIGRGLSNYRIRPLLPDGSGQDSVR